jgi:hypothetical protein
MIASLLTLGSLLLQNGFLPLALLSTLSGYTSCILLLSAIFSCKA